MAWVYARRYLHPKVALDPRDLMDNVNEYAREWNGFWDRDNIPEEFIAKADLNKNTFNKLDTTPMTTRVTIPAGGSGGWTDLDELTTPVECVDGAMVVDVHVNRRVECYGADLWRSSMDNVEMQLLVDGCVIAQTGWINAARLKSQIWLSGYSPVGAGTRTITVQVQTYQYFTPDVDYKVGGIGLGEVGGSGLEQHYGGTMWDHTFGYGSLTYRHVKR